MPSFGISPQNPISHKLLFKIISEVVIVRKNPDNQGLILTSNNAQWIFDFRRAFLKPTYLDFFAKYFWDEMEQFYPFQVGGLEMGVIPLLAAIGLEGLRRGKPANAFVVRKERKETGLGNKIEGTVGDEMIIIIDDLYNSGNSFLKVSQSVKETGHTVSKFFAFVHFGNNIGMDRLLNEGVEIYYPFTLGDFGFKRSSVPKSPYPVILPNIRKLCALENPNRFIIAPKSNPLLYKKYLICGGEGGTIVAIERDTGNIVWQLRVGFHDFYKSILSSPLLIGDLIIIGSYDGNLYCIDARTGKIVWRNCYADFIGSSPVYSEKHNLLFIGTEHSSINMKGGLLAVDKTNGRSLWFQSFAQFVHCSPGYSSSTDRVICGSNDFRLIICDAQSGTILHERTMTGEIKGGFGFSPDGMIAYFGDWDGYINAIDMMSGAIIWHYKTDNIIYTVPLVTPLGVFVGSYDKYFYHINAQDGTLIQRVYTGGKIASSAALVSENIISFASNDGFIYFYNCGEQRIIATINHNERITTKVIPHDGDIYFSDHLNQIFCAEGINNLLGIPV